jgi:hypothetical protein
MSKVIQSDAMKERRKPRRKAQAGQTDSEA